MPETKTSISVSGLQTRVKALLADPQLQSVWVTGELADASVRGGHFYADLVEKDTRGAVVAKVRLNMWRGVLQALRQRHGDAALQLLRTGTEVRLRGSVSHHPLYGMAFAATDVDPDYRKDAARRQAEILQALRLEGIADANKALQMPPVCQRIAVISSGTAAGYGDFMKQLMLNPARLRFLPTLFDAVMQGERVSPTVRAALAEIQRRAADFDCVVIIRGGGASTDLLGFDDLDLARAVALCPLPVIVGIGHERDNTVLDYIAHTRVKTPTAAAEYLVSRAAQVLDYALDLSRQIAAYVGSVTGGERRHLDILTDNIPLFARQRAAHARQRLDELTTLIPLTVSGRLERNRRRLDNASAVINSTVATRLTRAATLLDNAERTLRRDLQVITAREHQRLQAQTDRVQLLSPREVLKRGYSITRADGHAIRSAHQAPPGTTLTTTLYDGTVVSNVTPNS